MTFAFRTNVFTLLCCTTSVSLKDKKDGNDRFVDEYNFLNKDNHK